MRLLQEGDPADAVLYGDDVGVASTFRWPPELTPTAITAATETTLTGSGLSNRIISLDQTVIPRFPEVSTSPGYAICYSILDHRRG